ncbi:NAD-dependent epimerase/dehydratase family protein [Chryseobacterium paridis]|uniref:NAD-dependent epimerase/dehydratase family protein n=1 Tax=Chryseobacterium paridis TaxID=2800328 RepID=A0ABS1FX14_9FLAO|nr:NAD-dependent epimerase/dehydratase family protein [Chryseobacterium paridis]MBK1896978.1 NAD-dependent epimerase/dehydratase family protein [Chryseobacterium paridis]
MKKVFVTGITGLLGTNVVIKLLKDGYFVIALVRQKSRYYGQEDENLQLVEGDLLSDVSQYLKTVDFVIHIAAETSQNLLSYEKYKETNYDVVVHLFSESVEAGIKKFLFVSTANTMGYGDIKGLGNEQSRQKYPFTKSFYAQSKREAENYLLRNNKTTDVVILNPTFMIGAHDRKPSSGKIIYWVWKKKLVFYPSGGKNFVHVEDAAQGIINAIEKGKNGEKYLLAHENCKYKDFFKKVNAITEQNPLLLPLPDFVLIFLGVLGDVLRFFNIKTNLCSSNMKALRINNYYTGQKSIDELGIHYQPMDKAIMDAINFFENKEYAISKVSLKPQVRLQQN